MNSRYTSTPCKNGENSNVSTSWKAESEYRNHHTTPVRSKISNLCKNSILRNSQTKLPNEFFKVFPNYTPPSKNKTNTYIKNPFEHAHNLMKNLSQPVCSPSLFQFREATSPNKADNFSWSIEDVATFRPAQIDENPSQEFTSWFSPNTESKAQEAIDKFFESNECCSPWQTNSVKKNVLDWLSRTPYEEESGYKTNKTEDKYCQTTLSLPAELPKHVMKVLSCYMNDGGEELNTSDLNSSGNVSVKRKKLLFDGINLDESWKGEDLPTTKSPELRHVPFDYKSSPALDYKSSPAFRERLSPQLSPVEKLDRQSNLKHRSLQRSFTDAEMNSITEENMSIS